MAEEAVVGGGGEGAREAEVGALVVAGPLRVGGTAPTGLAPTADYRVVLEIDGTRLIQDLRVVNLVDQGRARVHGAPRR